MVNKKLAENRLLGVGPVLTSPTELRPTKSRTEKQLVGKSRKNVTIIKLIVLCSIQHEYEEN